MNFVLNNNNSSNLKIFSFVGYERAPRSVGGRILSAAWFMFVTLSLVTYTASLVNNLFWASTVHVRNSQLPFSSMEELLMHPEYRLGVAEKGMATK